MLPAALFGCLGKERESMTGRWKGWKIVLASASPRRKELLEQVGIEPQICPSHKEECTGETDPARMVMELSRVKAEDIAAACQEKTLVIGADTVVALGEEVMGKPKDEEEAFGMLKALSGRTHQVYTGVTVILCLGEGRFMAPAFLKKQMYMFTPCRNRRFGGISPQESPWTRPGLTVYRGLLRRGLREFQEITAMW